MIRKDKSTIKVISFQKTNLEHDFQPIFNYPSFALAKSSRNTVPATYDNTTTRIKYPSRFETPDCDAIDANTGNTTDSSYYSEDLELVRQLQEKTKSLMDASSRFQGNNSSYELYSSVYDSDNNRSFERQMQTFNNYNDKYTQFSI